MNKILPKRRLFIMGLMMTIFCLSVGFTKDQKVTAKLVIGDVTYLKYKKTKWKKLKIGGRLKPRDIIRTAFESSAELLLEDGSKIVIYENSEVNLTRLSERAGDKVSSISVRQGKIAFNIKKLTSKRSSFTFHIPTATAAIRGTQCHMAASSFSFGMGCSEGEVHVSSRKGGHASILGPGNLVIQRLDGSFIKFRAKNKGEFKDALNNIARIVLDPEIKNMKDDAADKLIHESVKAKEDKDSRPAEDTAPPLSPDTASAAPPDTAPDAPSDTAPPAPADTAHPPTEDTASYAPEPPAPRDEFMLTSILDPGELKTFKQRVRPGQKIRLSTAEQAILNNEFFRFKRWEIIHGNGADILNPSKAITFIRLFESDVSVKALYEKIQFKLTVMAEGNGTVYPSVPTTVPKGLPFEIKAQGIKEFKFTRWEVSMGDAVIEQAYSPVTKVSLNSSDAVIHAKFSKDIFKLRIKRPPAGGTVSFEDAEVEPETPVSISADTAEGYYFQEWVVIEGTVTIENPGHTSTKAVLKSSQAIIEPRFRKYLSVTITPQTGTVPSALKEVKMVKDGKHITLTADRRLQMNGETFEFDCWEIASGQAVLQSPELLSTKLTVTNQDVLVLAKYKKTVKRLLIEVFDENGGKNTLELDYR
ncbi:FecR domain-containing protein [Fibrobacterota bacterium]